MRSALAVQIMEKDQIADSQPIEMKPSDRELIQEFLSGNRRAFGTLVARYQMPLYRLIFRWVRDMDDAKDVMQKAFIRALNGLGEFQWRSSFKTWLYRIAINLAKNHLRDNQRFRKVELEEEMLSAEPEGDNRLREKIRYDRLWEIIETLPEKQREIIILRAFEGLPYEEIAQISGGSIGSAKVNYHYAIENVKKRFPDAENF